MRFSHSDFSKVLTRPFRLNRPETSLVLRTGRLQENPFLRIRVRADSRREEPRPQFAVLVPAASVALASARQRLKRRARHIIRELQPKIKSGQAVVIILKKATLGLSFEKLKEKITETLRQAKIL